MNIFSFANRENLQHLSPAKLIKFWQSYQRYKQFDMDPIIVGGAPRSGTTLLLAILGAHSAIHSVKVETMAFSLVRETDDVALNHKRNMDKFLKFLLMSDIAPGTRCWCEKTPNNVHHFRSIEKEFQGKVKIIHIIRDGRDIVTSRHPSDPDAYFTEPEDWIVSVNCGLRDRDKPNVHTLRYEDILTDFDKTIGDLIHFLELDWEPGMRTFNEKTTVRDSLAFKDGKVEALYTKSLEKWRKPEHEARIDAFYQNKEAVAMLEQLGYDISR